MHINFLARPHSLYSSCTANSSNSSEWHKRLMLRKGRLFSLDLQVGQVENLHSRRRSRLWLECSEQHDEISVQGGTCFLSINATLRRRKEHQNKVNAFGSHSNSICIYLCSEKVYTANEPRCDKVHVKHTLISPTCM